METLTVHSATFKLQRLESPNAEAEVWDSIFTFTLPFIATFTDHIKVNINFQWKLEMSVDSFLSLVFDEDIFYLLS